MNGEENKFALDIIRPGHSLVFPYYLSKFTGTLNIPIWGDTNLLNGNAL